MRRTNWAILGALALGLGLLLGPTALAEELGAPPAGVSASEPLNEVEIVPVEDEAKPPAETVGEVIEAGQIRVIEVGEGEVEVVEPDAPVPPQWVDPPESPVIPDEVVVIEEVPAPSSVRYYEAMPRMRRGGPCGMYRQCRGQGCRWTVSLEGSMTGIEGPEGPVGAPVPTGIQGLTWDDVDTCCALGGRLTVAVQPSRCGRIEVRGTYWGSWCDESQEVGAIGFAPPPGGFSPVGPTLLENEADLWGAEANYWHRVAGGRCTWLELGLGMRYVRFDETSRVSGLQLPNQGGTGYMEADALSQLVAGQIGVGGYWNVSRKIELSLLGKALLGWQSQRIDVRDDSVLSGGPHSASTRDRDFGWGFEVEARALWHVNRWLGLSAGAAMLYMGDVSRAWESFDLTQGATGAVQARNAPGEFVAVSLLVGVHFTF